MGSNTVLAFALFELLIIIALLAFRTRISGSIEGPMKTKLSIDASNPEALQGATIEDAKSHAGSILAEDQTECGASVRRVEAQQDIKVTFKAAVDRASVVRAVRGKYAYLGISSEEFAAQKQEEIRLEDRK